MIKRALSMVRFLESAVLVALLSMMIGLAAYQVIARNFYDTGLLWGDALVRVLVLWITLLGAMVASRNDEHIRMDLFSRFLTDIGKRALRRLSSLFTCVVCGAFAWFSFRFVRFDYEDQIIAFANVPAWICEAIMPFGAGVMALRYLLHTIDPPISDAP